MSLRRPIAWLLLLAVLITTNLHLPALQVAAWASMLIDYSRDHSLSVAVDMTFDGDHPCPMCKSIEAAATRHADEATAIEGVTPPQPLYVASADAAWIHVLVPLARLDLSTASAVRFVHRPSVPPPRSANT